MDKMTDHATITAEPRAHSNTPPRAIRPEILEVFRQGWWRDDSDRKRQNYQDAFDRLIHLFGRSPEMAIVSWGIAHNLALLIGDRDPRGWRWGGVRYDDPLLKKAVREFEDFEGLFSKVARKLMPLATQMQDCLPFHDKGLADLVKALQPFAHPRARAIDPRSDWHATAELFASRIETHFRTLRLGLPKRNSARSPLVLAVQSLLDMIDLHVEAEAIRKVLRRFSTEQALGDSTISRLVA
jgi:hypothetical protein